MTFAVLSLDSRRVLQLVCLTDNSFQAEIAYAFGGPSALWIRVSPTGFTIVKSRGIDRRLVRDAEFRTAVRAALQAHPEPRADGLPPTGTKRRECDRH